MHLIEDLSGKRVLFFLFFAVIVFLQPVRAQAESVEERIRDFFRNEPVMIEIARCESRFKQFAEDGQPLKGGWGGGMVGVFQIYETVHAQSARALGFDLHTLDGNLGYAKHLFATQGTSPWNSAKACWSKAVLSKPGSAATDTAELQKKIKELKRLVAKLQKLLAEKKKA